MNFEINLLII